MTTDTNTLSPPAPGTPADQPPAAQTPSTPPPSDSPAADTPQDQPTDTPPADTPPDSEDPDSPDGGGGGASARIRELLAREKALREYSEYWRELALARTTGAAEPPAPTGTADDPAPKLADFDSTEKWAEAHAVWTDRQIEKRTAAAVQSTLQTRESAVREQEMREAYARRLDEYEKVMPDARLVIANPTMTRALQAQPAIAEVVMASERGPELAVHLAKNPAELVRISRMAPTQAAAAIGRIEAKLPPRGGAPGPKPTPRPQPSRAPEPPLPIGGGGAPSIDDMNLPLEDFLAKLNRRGR